VALDVHRQYLVVGAVDAQQHVVLSPRRFGFEAFQDWAPAHLTVGDMLVLEATSNAWVLYDQLKPLVADVIVAHPQAVKLIAAARVKTDSRDTIKLASLLAANPTAHPGRKSSACGPAPPQPRLTCWQAVCSSSTGMVALSRCACF
jgi:hypothetical protein